MLRFLMHNWCEKRFGQDYGFCGTDVRVEIKIRSFCKLKREFFKNFDIAADGIAAHIMPCSAFADVARLSVHMLPKTASMHGNRIYSAAVCVQTDNVT